MQTCSSGVCVCVCVCVCMHIEMINEVKGDEYVP